ncbi:MAG: sulfotransferase, partial [Paracoccaceae bacterium]|nr:sulfotransferase [Paracoccaceae bacterium]
MQRDGGIFLFGLGAPKAGTSWLHGYLAAHPDVYVPPMKELHFFNSVDGNLAGRLSKLDEKRAKIEDRIERGVELPTKLDELQDVRSLLEDGSDAAYRTYMTERADARAVMADITPAYGLLSLERLLEMQAMGKSRFIYLMRDPVARLWSNVRMNAVRIVKKSGDDLSATCNALLQKVLGGKSPALQARCDYASTLKNIANIDPKRVLIAFYEELFTNETVTRICDFLEIAMMPAKFGQRVNEGLAVTMSEADRVSA